MIPMETDGTTAVIILQLRHPVQEQELGRDGGYFCRPDQGMPWPEEHARALEQAVEEYGRYPLVPPAEYLAAA